MCWTNSYRSFEIIASHSDSGVWFCLPTHQKKKTVWNSRYFFVKTLARLIKPSHLDKSSLYPTHHPIIKYRPLVTFSYSQISIQKVFYKAIHFFLSPVVLALSFILHNLSCHTLIPISVLLTVVSNFNIK